MSTRDSAFPRTPVQFPYQTKLRIRQDCQDKFVAQKFDGWYCWPVDVFLQHQLRERLTQNSNVDDARSSKWLRERLAVWLTRDFGNGSRKDSIIASPPDDLASESVSSPNSFCWPTVHILSEYSVLFRHRKLSHSVALFAGLWIYYYVTEACFLK